MVQLYSSTGMLSCLCSAFCFSLFTFWVSVVTVSQSTDEQTNVHRFHQVINLYRLMSLFRNTTVSVGEVGAALTIAPCVEFASLPTCVLYISVLLCGRVRASHTKGNPKQRQVCPPKKITYKKFRASCTYFFAWTKVTTLLCMHNLRHFGWCGVKGRRVFAQTYM